MFSGGAEYAEKIRKSGRTLHPEDDAPPMEWEAAGWWLYQRVETQWRYGFNGRTGLDYGPAIAICQDIGWPVSHALDLLQAVELARLGVRRERQSSQD